MCCKSIPCYNKQLNSLHIVTFHCTVIFSVHAHFKLEDGRRLGRVTCSPSETDENFNNVPINNFINQLIKQHTYIPLED